MKRVAIARALINKPSILIADEPTGDLDDATESEIMALFRHLNDEGITIVMVTHNPDLIPCATKVFRMDRGLMMMDHVLPSCHIDSGIPVGTRIIHEPEEVHIVTLILAGLWNSPGRNLANDILFCFHHSKYFFCPVSYKWCCGSTRTSSGWEPIT